MEPELLFQVAGISVCNPRPLRKRSTLARLSCTANHCRLQMLPQSCGDNMKGTKRNVGVPHGSRTRVAAVKETRFLFNSPFQVRLLCNVKRHRYSRQLTVCDIVANCEAHVCPIGVDWIVVANSTT